MQIFYGNGLALFVTFGDTARVAAPSVCFAAARILLAAAPTAPPCFRHWRRSSPLPLVGEPLAKPFTLRGLPKPLPLGEVAPKVTERASPARKSRCAAMGRLFVRAILSLCQGCLEAALPSQSGLRPPAPPKGEPLACRSAFVWTSEARCPGNGSAPLSGPATA